MTDVTYIKNLKKNERRNAFHFPGLQEKLCVEGLQSIFPGRIDSKNPIQVTSLKKQRLVFDWTHKWNFLENM